MSYTSPSWVATSAKKRAAAPRRPLRILIRDSLLRHLPARDNAAPRGRSKATPPRQSLIDRDCPGAGPRRQPARRRRAAFRRRRGPSIALKRTAARQKRRWRGADGIAAGTTGHARAFPGRRRPSPGGSGEDGALPNPDRGNAAQPGSLTAWQLRRPRDGAAQSASAADLANLCALR